MLADSGYPLKTFTMTPVNVPETQPEERYNIAHARTRVAIEQNIGVLKRRFAGLHYGLRSQPPRACKAVVACVVLHNIANERGDGVAEGDNIPLDPIHVYPAEPERQGRMNAGQMVRRRVIANYFT